MAHPEIDDPFEILGVPRDADEGEIRRAYRKLVRRLHPEVAPGRAARYRKVRIAYRVLVDPEGREGWERRRREPGQGEAGARDGSGRDGASVPVPDIGLPAEDAAGSAPTSRGRDVTVELQLDFAEAARGTQASFTVQREAVCGECRGGGGGERGEPCPRCGGRGQLVELDRVRLRVPAAVEPGTRLRLPGRGHRGRGGGRDGDLYVDVRVRPHPYFERRGRLDVEAVLPVTFAEAALGAEVEVPTVDGPVRIEVPRGTSGGTRFRLRGRGLTADDGTRGDHYVMVEVRVPEPLPEELEEALRRAELPDPRRGLPRQL